MALLKVKTTELEQLDTKVAAPAKAEAPKKEKDALGRTYGTGRRKNAIARVWIKAGKGKFSVNNRELDNYFPVETLRMKILLPFALTEMTGKFDVLCTVKGGGHTGQAGAIQLGIARALDKFDSVYHVTLRKNGMLTRDSRVVERKKYGKVKARKSTQFSKR